MNEFVCSVTRSLNGSGVGSDLVLIKTLLFLLCKSTRSNATIIDKSNVVTSESVHEAYCSIEKGERGVGDQQKICFLLLECVNTCVHVCS